jgi:hypothetical protein
LPNLSASSSNARGLETQSALLGKVLQRRALNQKPKSKNMKDNKNKTPKAKPFARKEETPPGGRPQTPAVVTGGGGYRESYDDVRTILVANTDKINNMQPTLRGMVKINGQVIDIAAWWSETKDGLHDYYSLKYQDSVAAKEAWAQNKERVEPLASSKLYQFRQRTDDDPPYVSAEPVLLGEKYWWVMLWVIFPEGFPPLEEATEEDLCMIQYPLVFSSRRPQEKWQQGLISTVRSAQAHLLERRRELEQHKLLKQRKDDYDDDDIPS